MRDFRDSSKQANESDTRRVEGSAEFSGDALEHLLDLMVGPGASVMRALAGMDDGAKARASPAAPAGEGGSEPQASGEIGAYLTQTYLMMATRGVHYWWRLAQ